ncbi:MAG TPA: hypothetical protein VJ875_25615 [Pyrinomonadaceae bacterium]|nr:hypothetical protein [Pyrinomonadaceae bacterium]
MSSSPLQVKIAIYGVLCPSGEDNMHAFDATAGLQAAINAASDGVVTITNEVMGGDPCVNTVKAWGAVVLLNGKPLYFAGHENDQVNFNYSQTGLNQQ